MKSIVLSIILLFFISAVEAQVIVDTTLVTEKDTVKTLQEAPDALKELLGSIISKEEPKSSNYSELEIDGLIFDETKTKSGRDFYDFFYRDWVAPPNSQNYSILVVEKPFRLSTTVIEILINDITVFQSFIQPRTDLVEQLALESINVTQAYLIRFDELVKELDGDDRTGSGIF